MADRLAFVHVEQVELLTCSENLMWAPLTRLRREAFDGVDFEIVSKDNESFERVIFVLEKY